jgi:hypothetical protein
MDSTDLDRLRENEQAFADANEQIREAAARNDVEPVPFLCECSARNCTDLIRLRPDEYRKVRASGGFMIRPGHDDPHVERIVADHGSYQVVEKFR